MKGKKIAALRICRWWKAKYQQLKEKKRSGNYLSSAVPEATAMPVDSQHNMLRSMRIIRSATNANIYRNMDILIMTEKARSELLSFYLSKTVSSSLDFHFILQSLNKLS